MKHLRKLSFRLRSMNGMATTEQPRRRSSAPLKPSGGVDGNERLTAATAVVLIVLLAALGVTILSIGELVWWHVLLGMLLIPPVLLKLGSTGWRFMRFYTGAREYMRRGPPLLPLRLMAPLVVASTLAVFATGVALLAVGPQAGFVVGLHKASFIVWLALTAMHVLAHLRAIPQLVTGDWRRRAVPPESVVPGTGMRRLALAATIVVGAVVAAATIRYAQPWVHFFASHHELGDG
jgi:hypothetical protein